MPLLNIKEVAEVLRISKQTAYRMVRDGSLRSVKVGKSVRVDLTTLNDFISGNAYIPEEADENNNLEDREVA